MVKSVSDRRDCGMIRIGNLVLPPDGNLELLRKRAANALGVRPGALGELEIIRQSIDARKKSDIHYQYTVEVSLPNEEHVIRSAPGRNITLVRRTPYLFPTPVLAAPGGGGDGACGTIRCFVSGPKRPALHCAGTGPRRGPAHPGCFKFLGLRTAGRKLQCSVRRGRRGHFL